MSKRTSLTATIILFIMCIIILKFFSGYSFIRGFGGDVVFTMMMFFGFLSIKEINPVVNTIIVIGITWIVEILQYFDFVSYVPMMNNRIGRIIFGSTFDPMDLLAYTIGGLLSLGLYKFNQYREYIG